jgi:PAS domain S-box-containing protein
VVPFPTGRRINGARNGFTQSDSIKLAAMTTESTPSELRETGISVIGDVRWGTHFCSFYETKADLLETLVLYFKAGLENKEFCVWVVSQALSVEEAKHGLGQAVPDLERRLAKGALEIHSHDEWYLRDGRWDPQRVLRSWSEKLKQISTNGYAGLRASGDAGWIQNDDWMSFRDYEKQVNAMIADQRSIILCTYPLGTSRGDQVFDLAHIHQLAVARRNGSWEMIETSELKEAKAKIKRLNEELEQKVEERTRELGAANEALRAEIAERKLAEEAVKLAENRIRRVIDTTPALIHTGRPDGYLDYFNQPWLKYVGLSLEEIEGWAWTNVIHPEDVEGMVNEWRAVIASGEPYRYESRVRRAEGEYRWMLHHKVPLRDEQGDIVKWYGSSIDIEDRKQAEKEWEEASHQLRFLSRRLLHIQEEERRHLARELHDEIGQTLTAAKLNLKIIGPDMPAKVTGRLEDSIQLLDRLLVQVRELSLDLRPPVLDELGLVPALRWLVDQQGQRAGLHMSFSARVEELRIDPAVRTACFRVAQEAITNVIRHSGAKNVAVDLRREADRLTLRVRDDGAGFDPAVIQQKATQDFTLGLVSMKERALLVGGGFEVHSGPGQGTEIRAWFPLPFAERPSAETA